MKNIGESMRNGITVIIAVSILSACGTSDSDMKEQMGPEANGTAVWSHLQQEQYQDAWNLWPGTEELYEGNEPHGMLLTTYLNEVAYQAAMNGNTSMPNGAIIVKENYTPDSTFNSVTTMYKVQGYNPEHQDWFWMKNTPEGTIDAEGKVDGCQSCHQQAPGNDYIYTELP